MDINTIYERIKEKLDQVGYSEIINDLENLIAAGATSSEILFSSGKYLFDLEKNKPDVYKIIEEEIINYLKYCYQLGLEIN